MRGHRCTGRQSRHHVKTGAATGERQPQTKDTTQESRGVTRGWKRQGRAVPLGSLEGVGLCQHFDSRFLAPSAVREYVAIVVSHQVCGNLSWWPRKTNTRCNLRLHCKHLATSLCLYSSRLHPPPNLDPELHQHWQILSRLAEVSQRLLSWGRWAWACPSVRKERNMGFAEWTGFTDLHQRLVHG